MANARRSTTQSQADHESAKVKIHPMTRAVESAEKLAVGTGHHSNQDGSMSADGFIENVVFSQHVGGSQRIIGPRGTRSGLSLAEAIARVDAALIAYRPVAEACDEAQKAFEPFKTTGDFSAADGLPLPEALRLPLSHPIISKITCEYSDGSRKIFENDSNPSASEGLNTKAKILDHCGDDTERAKSLLKALRSWVGERRRLMYPPVPPEGRKAEANLEVTRQERRRLRNELEQAGLAVLGAVSKTSTEAVVKARAFAMTHQTTVTRSGATGLEGWDAQALLKSLLKDLQFQADQAKPSCGRADGEQSAPNDETLLTGETLEWAALKSAYYAKKADYDEADAPQYAPGHDEARCNLIRPLLGDALELVFNYQPCSVLELAEKRDILCNQDDYPRRLVNVAAEERINADAERIGIRAADDAVIASGDPDARFLVWWGENCRVVLPSLSAHEDESAEDKAVWSRLGELHKLIQQTPARGLTGAMVKLRTILATELGMLSTGEAAHDREGLFKVLAALEGEHLRRFQTA